MKILFIGLAAAYTDGCTYQDELLAEQCARDGHQVAYISNAEEIHGGRFEMVEEGDTMLPNGIRLIQFKYNRVINNFVTQKLRVCKQLPAYLESIAPDIIFLHSPCTLSVPYILKYMKKHENVKLMVDSHSDYYTSGTNFFSRNIMHRLLYGRMCRKCVKAAGELLCVADNCMKFAHEVYGIPNDKITFYPLGGIIPDHLEETRQIKRKEFGYRDDEVILLQAGKMDGAKKLIEALEVFSGIDSPKLKYVVAGSVGAGIQEKFEQLCRRDPRIQYIGWKKGPELLEHLLACDIYVQPGKVSAIAQNAMCAGAAVILRRCGDYERLVDGNGWLIGSAEELKEVFEKIAEDRFDVTQCRKKSMQIAEQILDYRVLAEKIYET